MSVTFLFLMTSITEGMVFHFAVSSVIVYLVIKDSFSREGKLPHWGILLVSIFNFWAFALPFYFVRRRLLEGEMRTGGYYWNLCRYFVLLWTLLFIVFLSRVVVQRSTQGDFSDLIAAIAASGIFYSMWFAGVSLAAVVGFTLRRSDLVEVGAGEPMISVPAVPLTPPVQLAIAYTVSRAGQEFGKFSELDLLAAIESGAVVDTDHFWTNGMKAWLTIRDFKKS